MSARIATHSVRDLRDALDAAERDLANGEPGAAHAVRYNRRELESMAHGIACDLLDARDELASAQSHLTHALDDAATQRARADAAEAEVARLTTERDAARRAATLAETERDGLRALTDALRADNVRLRAIVESLRSARAVSAAAAARYTAAWDAVGTMPPTPAQSEEIAAALRAAYEAGDALTAALDAAGEGR